MIKIILADDHTIVREGLKALLNSQQDIEVIDEAGNGLDLLEKTRHHCPDIVVMDIAMPEMNGIETTGELKNHCPQTRVVILSVYSSSEHIYRAFLAGASAYVLKEAAGQEIVKAIQAVYHDRLYVCQKIREEMPDIMESIAAPNSPLARLSKREREVLQLVVEGKSSSTIAEQLSLSPKTVETYRSRLMQKLQVKDLPALIKFAIQQGITPF